MKREKFDEINEILKLYFDYLDYLNQSDSFTLTDNEIIARSIAYRHVARVFRTFMRLDNKEKDVINKSFVDGDYERNNKALKGSKRLARSVSHFLKEYHQYE